MDLFRFMESFHDGTGRRVGAQGDNLVVPANCLDRYRSHPCYELSHPGRNVGTWRGVHLYTSMEHTGRTCG